MSITIDLPPAMVQEAREYATARGTTLEKMMFDYLDSELKASRKDDHRSEFEAFSGILDDAEADEIRGNLRQFDRIDSEKWA